MKNTAPYSWHLDRNLKPAPPDTELKIRTIILRAAFGCFNLLVLKEDINSEAGKLVDDDGNITAKRRL